MSEDENKSSLPATSVEDTTESARDSHPSTRLFVGSPIQSDQITIIQNTASYELSSNDSAPRLIDERFAVERELGRGGIGVAYLASDTRDNNRRVVVKVLLNCAAKKRVWIERHFREEVKALSRINHTGVVSLIASGNLRNGEPYIAMEFVEGCDLRSQIEPERGLRDFSRIASIIRQLGDAISAAHDKGIYHRDLKPENIMIETLEDREYVKVIDFGIATVKESLDERTKTTALAGSVRYMAPEQIVGKPSRATDIYALGIIAYEMITGRTPFNPDLSHPLASLRQLFQMQRFGVRVMPKDLRPSLPASAQAVILRALQYNVANRYERADVFGRELAGALSEEDPDWFTESYVGHGGMSVPEASPASLGVQGRPGDAPQQRGITKVIGWVCGLLVIVALMFFAWSYFKGGSEVGTRATSGLSEHTLSYWVLAQKYKDKKPDGAPARLLGREMYFGSGDELQFFVTGSDDGHLYLLSEEPGGKNGGYFLLFPTPKANNSSSQIQANIEVATDRGFFDERVGTEKVWIVWSLTSINELEDEISRWTDKNYFGEISEPTKVSFLRNLLEENSNGQVRVEQDDLRNRMTIKSPGNVIVRLLTLAHR